MSPHPVSSGTKIRLLRCNNCGTLEELPDFHGRPDDDVLLELLMSKHETNGERHIGRLIDVDERAWGLPNIRREIIEQIKGGSKGLAAFDPQYYNVRDTFKEDALKCYSQHQRPQAGCLDWHADSKRLLPNTRAERKELGLSMASAPSHYLCSHCPVAAYYARKARGD